MVSAAPSPSIISPALSAAINALPDADLKVRLDILVAKTTRALTSARTIHFVGYEDRQLADNGLELWTELAPLFGAVFKEIRALVEAVDTIFPQPLRSKTQAEQDFDLAFDLLAPGEAHPVTGQQVDNTPQAKVTALAHSYAQVLRLGVQQQMLRLKEPSVMGQQWNLLGELEEFRDKMVGAMHAMVVSIMGVFDDVEVEAFFPAAYEMTEMGVALRRHVADLAVHVNISLSQLTPDFSADALCAVLADADELTAMVLKLPSLNCVRAVDRHTLALFRREAARLRAGTPLVDAVRVLLEKHSSFLSTLNTVELRDRLAQHDREVAQEAARALKGALQQGATHPKQAMLYVAHAARRVARLYGLSPRLDLAARQLPPATASTPPWTSTQPLLKELMAALAPLTV